MKKYFCVSDIHGFYDELMISLDKAGFDLNNQDHVLVVCGDIFDRGTKPLEVYNFLMSLPKERRILIRGNHEILLNDLVKRGYAESHDAHNGTVDTLYYLAGLPNERELTHEFYRKCHANGIEPSTQLFDEMRQKYDVKRRSIWKGKVKKILDWIYSDDWVNFWETSNYVFVHSWIPLFQQINFEKSMWTGYLVVEAEFFRDDWRNATQDEWNDAMWGCPWKKAKEKLNKTGKTIVCGHWHTSDFFNNLTKQKKQLYDCPIFKSKRYKLIGLDACTVASHKINVLVLNEEEL